MSRARFTSNERRQWRGYHTIRYLLITGRTTATSFKHHVFLAAEVTNTQFRGRVWTWASVDTLEWVKFLEEQFKRSINIGGYCLAERSRCRNCLDSAVGHPSEVRPLTLDSCTYTVKTAGLDKHTFILSTDWRSRDVFRKSAGSLDHRRSPGVSLEC